MDNEITHTSYIQRIKNSFIAIPIGLILFIASFYFLWCNEGNSIRLSQKEDFIKNNAIEISSDNINRENDSKLIATNGSVYSDQTLSDSIISIENALNLERHVEMYQWIEKEQNKTQSNIDGSTTKITTYSYKKAWSSTEHNSDKFKKTGYNNPKFPLYSKTISSDIAYMGDFMLNLYKIEQINDYENVQDIPINDNYKIFDNYQQSA